VEIPAVVIKASLTRELLNFTFRLFIETQESHNNIRHLDRGVVDVILNIHLPAGESQQPHKSVAQDGIAQMSDVRSFVWVDAGMLDKNFTDGNLGPGLHVRRQSCS